MPLRHMIRNFIDPVDARTAANLTRQLADFEDNVATETDDIRTSFLPSLKPRALAASSSGAMLSPGSSLGIDTSASDLQVLLARPEAKFAGKFAAVWKRAAANNLILMPPRGVNINGASSLSVATVGLLLIFCDGVEYWA